MASVLVAIEDSGFLSYVAGALASGGHEVVRTETIDGVFDAVAEDRFDLVAAEIFQPVLEGVSLFATLARAFPATRLVAITDFRTARAHNYNLQLWSDSVLAKPLSGERLRQEVQWLLARPSRRPLIQHPA